MTSENFADKYLKPAKGSLGFLLSDNTRLTRRAFAVFLEAHQLTPAAARVLVYLGRSQGLRQVDLADLLDIQPITLARLIDQLAEAGLVERRADPTDRRAFQLYLTAVAAPILADIGESSSTFQDQALAGLTPEQIDTLFLCLNRVRDNLSAMLR